MNEELAQLSIQALMINYRRTAFDPHNRGVERLNAYLDEAEARDVIVARLTQANAELAAEIERLKAQLAEAESQNWAKRMTAIVDEINADVRNLKADK